MYHLIIRPHGKPLSQEQISTTSEAQALIALIGLEAFQVLLQNIRGGRVKLTGIVSPEMEFNHPEKGDALHAMELALSLEVNSHYAAKMYELHWYKQAVSHRYKVRGISELSLESSLCLFNFL